MAQDAQPPPGGSRPVATASPTPPKGGAKRSRPWVTAAPGDPAGARGRIISWATVAEGVFSLIAVCFFGWTLLKIRDAVYEILAWQKSAVGQHTNDPLIYFGAVVFWIVARVLMRLK